MSVLPPPQPTPPSSITVLNYNMLATSLTSPTIPWMLSIPPNVSSKFPGLRSRIEREYSVNWHKNLGVGGGKGGWKRWRKVFGSVDLNNIDFERLGLDVEVENAERGLVGGKVCTTFRGIVRDECGEGGEVEVWLEELETLKKTVYSWSCGRGLKILDLVTGKDRSRWEGIDDKVEKPDVIIMTEYDIHGDEPGWEEKGERQGNNYPPPLLYDESEGDGDVNDIWVYDSGKYSRKKEGKSYYTFSQAMCKRGYHSVLVQGPGEDGSGKGLFFNKDVFEYERGLEIEGGARWDVVGCGDKYEGGIRGVDLREVSTGMDGEVREWGVNDRRSVAVAKVGFKGAPGKSLVLVAAHLQTKSKDKDGKVLYPGEVRAGELENIKRVFEEQVDVGEEDVVVFGGDFNANIRGTTFEERDVLRGVCKGGGRTFDTGYVKGDRGEGKFVWKGVELNDCFEGINNMKENEKGQAIGSSVNAVRCETIDYIFSNREVLARNQFVVEGLEGGIPDEMNPSDHLPVIAQLLV